MNARNANGWTLRPLSIGEILDRAITLTVRNFALLASIALAYALPLAILTYYGTQDQSQLFAALLDALKDTAAGKTVDMKAILRAQEQATAFNASTAFLYVWMLVGLPIYSTALIVAAAMRYRGLESTPWEAYRITLRRAGVLVAIALVYLAVFLLTLAAAFIALFSITLGIALLSAFVRTATLAVAGLVLLALATFASALAGSVLVALGYLAVHLAWMASAVEDMPLVAAASSGFARVFSRPVLRRSLYAGLTYITIALGYSVFALASEGLIVALLHSKVAAIALSTFMQMLVSLFFAAFYMVYYYDVRVRREGLDLQIAATAAGAVAAPLARHAS